MTNIKNEEIKKDSPIKKKAILNKISTKVVALVVLGVIIGVLGTFLYIQKFGIPFSGVLQNVSKAEEAKILQKTINEVGELIVLPKDETPVMATIIDATTLAKEQPFYVDAKNGDIVLMYQKALKAIIYRPSDDIIVNVGPVYVEPDEKNSLVELKEKSSATSTE